MIEIGIPTSGPDVAALRSASDKLFAEHAALVKEIEPRAAARSVAADAALARQTDAYDVEERAWDVWSAARDACRAHPADPASPPSPTRPRPPMGRPGKPPPPRTGRPALSRSGCSTSPRRTDRLLKLGDQFRAAQDAYIEADMQATRQSVIETDPFAADILQRCRRAQAHHDGHPSAAWSTGEQLAVALVLRDRQHLDDMGYTPPGSGTTAARRHDPAAGRPQHLAQQHPNRAGVRRRHMTAPVL